MTDVRWQQRFNNFSAALSQLASAVQLAKQRALSTLEQQGLIQGFEYTHELAWNVLKDYLEYQGTTGITGSRDATREAFRLGLISNGDAWMEMIVSRNKTSHAYNPKIADDIAQKTIDTYHSLFAELEKKMQSLKNK